MARISYCLDIWGPRSILTRDLEQHIEAIAKSHNGSLDSSGTCFATEDPERDITLVFDSMADRKKARKEIEPLFPFAGKKIMFRLRVIQL